MVTRGSIVTKHMLLSNVWWKHCQHNSALYLLLSYLCHCRQYETHLDLHSAQYSSLTLTKFGFSWQIFIKVMNTKFHRNLSSRIHCDTCRQKDMMKLVDASQNYAHTTKHLLIARMCLWCKCIKYYECVYIFALIIQHADCMFSALYYMACVDLPYFSTFLEKNYRIYNVSFDFLYNACLKHLILRINQQYI